MVQLSDWETVLTENNNNRKQSQKKDQYKQCDDKNSSRFGASIQQDIGSKIKNSNNTTHNCDTRLQDSEYRAVMSLLTFLPISYLWDNGKDVIKSLLFDKV